MTFDRFGIGSAPFLIISERMAKNNVASYYISLDGSDNNSGNLSKPFRTVQRAQAVIREKLKNTSENIDVNFRKGTYYLGQTLCLTEEDSGSDHRSITYQACPGEQVTLSAASRLSCTWLPFRDGIYVCKPNELCGHAPFFQLFINGKRQVLARTPNYNPEARFIKGFVGSCYRGQISGKPGYTYPISADAWPHHEIYLDPDYFAVKRWAHPEEAILHTFNENYWGSLQYQIKAYDPARCALVLGAGGDQINCHCLGKSATGIGKRSAFYLENLFEELDTPGEWYFDQRSGLLYHIPEAGVDLAEAVVEAAELSESIKITGKRDRKIENIHIEGFHFTGSEITYLRTQETPSMGDWGIHRGGVVFFENANHCKLANCTFSGIGGSAVFISNDCADITIADCKFDDIGENAICLVGESHLNLTKTYTCPYCGFIHPWGWDEPSSRIPRNCLIVNNKIRGIGIYGKQTAGVFVSMASEITISHNHIYHTPRAAICINDGIHGGHVVEYNDIHDTVLETGDHGPFNAWGREPYWCLSQSHKNQSHAVGDVKKYAAKTSLLHDNLFRDHAGWGIDLDDGSSNWHVYNNLCIGIGVKLREGDFRLIENNIFINSAMPPGCHCGYEGNNDIFRRNVIVNDSAPVRSESDISFTPGQSAESMLCFIHLPVAGSWFKEWDNNLYYNNQGQFAAEVNEYGGQITKYNWEEWHAKGWDQHSLFVDPEFYDYKNGDFRLLPSSPAFKIGFKAFMMHDFGTNNDN